MRKIFNLLTGKLTSAEETARKEFHAGFALAAADLLRFENPQHLLRRLTHEDLRTSSPDFRQGVHDALHQASQKHRGTIDLHHTDVLLLQFYKKLDAWNVSNQVVDPLFREDISLATTLNWFLTSRALSPGHILQVSDYHNAVIHLSPEGRNVSSAMLLGDSEVIAWVSHFAEREFILSL